MLDVLERQLAGRSITVAGACKRLNTHLQQATLEDVKALQNGLLVKLLSVVVCSGGRISWMSGPQLGQDDKQSLYELLRPDGPLFRLLIANSAKAAYEIGVDELPFPTRKQLCDLGKKPSTPLYRDRLVLVSSSEQKRWVLRLDPAEYFLFYLLYLPFLDVRPRAGDLFQSQASYPIYVNDAITLPTPGSLPVHFQSSVGSELYRDLLYEFFNYLLPLKGNSHNVYLSAAGQHSVLPSVAGAIRLSDYFVQMAIELLFNQHLYDLDAGAKPFGQPPFPQPPSLEYAMAVSLMAEHLTEAWVRPALNVAVQSLVEANSALFRIGLYRWMRLSLRTWSADNTISVWIEIWLTAACPWRNGYSKDDVPAAGAGEWLSLVHFDYHFYHTLADDLIDAVLGLLETWAAVCSDPGIDLERLTSQALPVVSGFLDFIISFDSLAPKVKQIEAECEQPHQRSQVSRAVHDQLSVREPLSKFPRPMLFAGPESKARAGRILSCMDTLLHTVIALAVADEPAQAQTLINMLQEAGTRVGDLFELTAAQRRHYADPRAPEDAGGSATSHWTGQPPLVVTDRRRLIVAKTPNSSRLAAKREEVAWLVPLLERANAYIDGHVPRLLRGRLRVRFLAVPANLVFTLASLFVLAILFRLLL